MKSEKKNYSRILVSEGTDKSNVNPQKTDNKARFKYDVCQLPIMCVLEDDQPQRIGRPCVHMVIDKVTGIIVFAYVGPENTLNDVVLENLLGMEEKKHDNAELKISLDCGSALPRIKKDICEKKFKRVTLDFSPSSPGIKKDICDKKFKRITEVLSFDHKIRCASINRAARFQDMEAAHHAMALEEIRTVVAKTVKELNAMENQTAIIDKRPQGKRSERT